MASLFDAFRHAGEPDFTELSSAKSIGINEWPSD
jgi:hypothetical protein